MATMPQFVPSEVVHDLDFPQREAAFFYGLFLRGHSADKLRRDIEVPPVVLAKWHREAERDPQLRDIFTRMVDYRRHVLAIFDILVGSDSHHLRAGERPRGIGRGIGHRLRRSRAVDGQQVGRRGAGGVGVEDVDRERTGAGGEDRERDRAVGQGWIPMEACA